MEAKSQNIATSPGGSDIPQEASSKGRQGSPGKRSANSKTAGVPAQASVGIHVDVQRCATNESENGNVDKEGHGFTKDQQNSVLLKKLEKSRGNVEAKGVVQLSCSDGSSTAATETNNENALRELARNTQKKPGLTRVQAEVKYGDLLDAAMAGIGKLEAAVSAAPNTKTEIKTCTRDLTATLREFLKVSKALGLTRTVDTSEQRLAAILQAQQQQQQLQQQQYQQQQQQHQQMIEASAKMCTTLAEIQRQITVHEEKLTMITEAPASHQAERRLQQLPQQPKQHQQREQVKQVSNNTATHEEEGEFTVVRGKKALRRTKAKAPSTKPEPKKSPSKETETRRHAPRTQAVVLEKLANKTYADTVRDVKEAVRKEPFDFEISARRTKAGNLILETQAKEHADDLAGVLKRQFGESRNIRRPSPSIALLLVGIEDSVDEDELLRTIAVQDNELTPTNIVKIREGANGVRTAIVRVPLAPGLKLASLKKLRVGWATCRIKELVRKKGCAKCSAPDHVTSDCKGEETRRCFKCKTVGHLIASCKVPQSSDHHRESSQSRRVDVPVMVPSTPKCP